MLHMVLEVIRFAPRPRYSAVPKIGEMTMRSIQTMSEERCLELLMSPSMTNTLTILSTVSMIEA